MSNMEELQLKLKDNAKIQQELEAKLVQSAHYGKVLLEQLTESKEMREELEQEKHSLKLKLQTVLSSEKAFQEEIQGKETKSIVKSVNVFLPIFLFRIDEKIKRRRKLFETCERSPKIQRKLQE